MDLRIDPTISLCLDQSNARSNSSTQITHELPDKLQLFLRVSR